MSKSDNLVGLVADIGGTNGRFALIGTDSSKLLEQKHYALADFNNFNALVEQFLHDCGQNSPLNAVIAIAGPVEDNRCQMTNAGWRIDGEQLQKDGVFASCLLLNDFAALAASLPYLNECHLKKIGPDVPSKSGTKLVLGPGTGLGAAFLAQSGTSSHIVEGEGGHMGFAPVDEVEVQLRSWLGKKYGRVSMERLLSGGGLEDLHQALAQIEGRLVDNLPAEHIMSQGLDYEGDARQTLLRFCAILGSFAGDLALAGGCWNGIYIGGGIVPRMPEFLATSPFRERFEAKGRFAAKMRLVPSCLITHKTPALLGAASYL